MEFVEINNCVDNILKLIDKRDNFQLNFHQFKEELHGEVVNACHNHAVVNKLAKIPDTPESYYYFMLIKNGNIKKLAETFGDMPKNVKTHVVQNEEDDDLPF